jgi:hypothetical protein
VGAGREFLQPLPPHLGSIKAMLRPLPLPSPVNKSNVCSGRDRPLDALAARQLYVGGLHDEQCHPSERRRAFGH